MNTYPYATSDDRLVEHLIRTADASRRDDGTDIPLGELCRRAAQRLQAAREPITATIRITEEGSVVFSFPVPGDERIYVAGVSPRLPGGGRARRIMEHRCLPGEDVKAVEAQAAIRVEEAVLADAESEDRPVYSEGIYGDGAAILKDGVMMTLEQVVAELNAETPSRSDGEETVDFVNHDDGTTKTFVTKRY